MAVKAKANESMLFKIGELPDEESLLTLDELKALGIVVFREQPGAALAELRRLEQLHGVRTIFLFHGEDVEAPPDVDDLTLAFWSYTYDIFRRCGGTLDMIEPVNGEDLRLWGSPHSLFLVALPYDGAQVCCPRSAQKPAPSGSARPPAEV